MTPGVRTAITLAAVCLGLVVAALWGWQAATEPLPAKVDTPLCVDKQVPADTKVYPQEVTISVYNAGNREGLAGRTMRLFTDEGFAEGVTGNVSAKVSVVQIWTLEPTSPSVQLVASWLGRKAQVERRQPPGVGVAVVVGDGFQDLVDGSESVTAEEDATICSPPVI